MCAYDRCLTELERSFTFLLERILYDSVVLEERIQNGFERDGETEESRFNRF